MNPAVLAVNSISTTHSTLEAALDAYAQAGFQNVEFALSQVHKELNAGRTRADVRDMLDARQLKCIGGFETGVTCFQQGEARRENHQKMVDNARLVADLGGKILVAGTDGPPDDHMSIAPLADVVLGFQEVARQIADTGVILCLEFNWSPIVKSLRAAVEVARRADRDNVGVLFDTAHYYCTSSKLDQINADSVPLIRHVHVNDMRDKAPELCDCNSDRVLPGSGCLDLTSIFSALKSHGYKGYYAIEMFNDELWALPPSEAAERMYKSLEPFCDDAETTCTGDQARTMTT